MITYERYKLTNGLTVLLHQDKSSPLVTVNVLYKVGSRNESSDKTGFAHLFEHLMFGGSENIPDFDTPIQEAGGDSNAFTNSDITNYYNILPADNLETALWLESDRMKQLKLDQKALDIQKKVVIEEFKETSINKPYGDVWHELSDLAYKNHPYRWPTIGLELGHIEQAELMDVKAFFDMYYRPNNAILVICGNIALDSTKAMIEKWFGDIPAGPLNKVSIPNEQIQVAKRTKTCHRPIPSAALYLAFPMPDRKHKDFIVYDILSDILGGGRSSRLYRNLLINQNLFSNIGSYISGTLDAGLFIIDCKLLDEITSDVALEKIWHELESIKKEPISEEELQKVKNGLISSVVFSEVNVNTKAINLAYYEFLGDASMINLQVEEIEQVTTADLSRVVNELFDKEICSELRYLKQVT